MPELSTNCENKFTMLLILLIFFDIESGLCYKFFTSTYSIQREAEHDKKNQSPGVGCEKS
jgi:hypothetical protein